MTRHLYGSCGNDDCPACESEAEARRDDREQAVDWQLGTDRYEAELDGRWVS